MPLFVTPSILACDVKHQSMHDVLSEQRTFHKEKNGYEERQLALNITCEVCGNHFQVMF